MAALILGKDSSGAGIEGNLNGGFGSYEPNFSFGSSSSFLDYSLGVGPDDSLFFNYNSGSGTHSFDSVSIYDTADFFNGGTSLSATPFQQGTTTQIGLQYGFASPTFGNTYFAADDSGYLGDPDWLSTVGSQLGDPVIPLTGELCMDTTDLTFPGPFPLQIRRNYLSQNRSANQFGVGWKWALTPFLVLTNSTQGGINLL